MKAEVITKRFITCPRCLTLTWPVDHLAPGSTWGPWSCPDSDCTAAVKGIVCDDGSIDIEVFDKPEMVLALFQFRGLYLVVSGYSSTNGPEHYDFLFHSHQCPESMLRSTIAVYDPETGIDPHGVLRFVAAVPDSEALRERIGAGKQRNGDESLARLFAEFHTDGVPPPSKWPEHNGGMLDGLADAQRESRSKGEA